jgi:hypothetical protein
MRIRATQVSASVDGEIKVLIEMSSFKMFVLHLKQRTIIA